MNKYFLFTWNGYPLPHADITGPSQQYRGSFSSVKAAQDASGLSFEWNEKGGTSDSAEILTMKNGDLVVVMSGCVMGEDVYWKLPDGTVERVTSCE